MRTRKPLQILFALFLTFIGAYTAFTVFSFLSLRGFEAKQQPKKDTLLIKLVDGISYMPGSQDYGSNNERKPKLALDPETLELIDRDSNNLNYLKIPFRQPSFAKPIPPDSVKNAYEAALLKNTHFPWWVVIFSAVILLAAVFYVLYNKLPYLSSEMREDLDPTQLTALLQQFGKEIESLGNPRKIKRLSNKIRFQYHYLQSKGWNSYEHQEQLVNILFLLETNKTQAGDKGSLTNSFVQTEAAFSAFFKKNLPMEVDEKFLHVVYALNRESFY